MNTHDVALVAATPLDQVWTTMQFAAWTSQIITGLLTVLVLLLTVKQGYRLKSADTRADHQRRFDQLLASKDQLQSRPAPTSQQAVAYCERFWNLQNDQFSEWRKGFLPEHTLRAWMQTRGIEWRLNEVIAAQLTYQAGWKAVKDGFIHTDFRDFMETIFDPTKGLTLAFKKYRPNVIKRSLRWIFG